MLGQYQITQQISSKAGRSTYLAEDFQTKQQVILKFLEFNELFAWEDLKLFEREAKTLKNLSYPFIPNYLDYFEVNETNRQGFVLVQSYINAPSLGELIAAGIKFSESEIIELAQKLLDILNYLHQLNPPVIHRDIKPSNILLNNRSGNSIGDVYLVDFGSVQTSVKKKVEQSLSLVAMAIFL
ncbi:MAG: protein kinase [Cyanobacteria bacterium J06600_6]